MARLTKTLLIVVLYFAGYTYGFAADCQISFEVLCNEGDSVLLEVYGQDRELVLATYNRKGSFDYPFEPDDPSSLYFVINSNMLKIRRIIVDTVALEFRVVDCDQVVLQFSHSTTNSLYQKFYSAKNKTTETLDSLIRILSDKENPMPKDRKDTLIGLYKVENENVDKNIRLLEDKFIRDNPKSFFALFLMNESLKFHEREDIKAYSALIELLDSTALAKFTLYGAVKHIGSLRAYVNGNELGVSDTLLNANGDRVSLRKLVDMDEYQFMYLWNRECSHSKRLMLDLNDRISKGELEAHRIVSINYEQNITPEDISNIQSENQFKCYFSDPEDHMDLAHRLWIKFTPFGVITKNGRIIKLACHFDDFLEFL